MREILTFQRYLKIVLLFAAVLAAFAAASPFIGAERIDAGKAIRDLFSRGGGISSPDADILFFQRIPRILLAILAGGALGLAGSVFQALLRNPLAEPFTLGVSTGGALGALFALSIPAFSVALPFSSMVQVFAFLGSTLNVSIIYALSRRKQGLSPTGLLLAGVTLNMICGAAILLLRYLAHPHELVSMERWMVGGLDIEGYEKFIPILPFLIAGLVILILQARHFDQLCLGEELARSRGVRVERLQRLAFFGGSLITAAVVSIAGPIGFVGLIIPHIVRGLAGSDHRILLPCSFLAAGSFLVLCDTFARTVIAPSEMPVGIVTAMTGGPFFLWLLVRKGTPWGVNP